MRTILILCGVVLIGGGLLAYRLLRVPTTFGAFVGAPSAEVSDVVSRPTEFLHKTVALHDVIRDQCKTMGCYFFFEANGKKLRIELAEIAMRAPKGRDGRRARVEGQLVPSGDAYQVMATAVTFE